MESCSSPSRFIVSVGVLPRIQVMVHAFVARRAERGDRRKRFTSGRLLSFQPGHETMSAVIFCAFAAVLKTTKEGSEVCIF